MGIKIDTAKMYAVDKKNASRQWISQIFKVQHIFERVSDVEFMRPCSFRCKGGCRLSEVRPHCLVGSPDCQPYSKVRKL